MAINAEKIGIPEEEVEEVGYNYDELGKVFVWKGRLFRMIYPEKTNFVNDLLASGLIQELIEKRLFPKTTISPFKFRDSLLVLEHELISPVIYPANWSFEMIKDAALCILKVNEIARRYGYQTLDGHGFNVLFNACQPMFIDFGSFIKNVEDPNGWRAIEEFVRYFIYPLKIFKDGNIFFGRASMQGGKSFLTHSSYLKYRNPIYRFLRNNKIDFIVGAYYRFKSFYQYNVDEIEKRAPSKIVPLLRYLKRNNVNFLNRVSFQKEIKRVEKVRLPKFQSQWGYYHNKFIETDGQIASLTPRFNRIIEVIKELSPQSIIEIGGNQGVFSQLISQETNVAKILCTDYDEVAVNKMYNRFKAHNISISTSILDIVNPSYIDYGESIYERYRSEMLIALAISHHLILTQKLPLKEVFNQFGKFTSKYVVTEFMPLGLYSEDLKHEYTPPTWYTESWFQQEFEEKFILLKKERLEKNRILFVGEKRQFGESDMLPQTHLGIF